MTGREVLLRPKVQRMYGFLRQTLSRPQKREDPQAIYLRVF